MKNAAERSQKKQKRKADESVLQAKREEMGKNKVFLSCPLSNDPPTLLKISDAVKRYSYLLGQTELFKHFVDIKVRSVNETFAAVTSFNRISRKRATHNMQHFLMHSRRRKRGVAKKQCKLCLASSLLCLI